MKDLEEIARWYNDAVSSDPSNPPGCREVARFAGSASGNPATGHRILGRLEAEGKLKFPRRKRATIGGTR